MISIVIVSKDEPRLGQTLCLVAAQADGLEADTELIVVDASEGRLGSLRLEHQDVHWIDFEPIPGVGVTIPHQRNLGVLRSSGDVVVFTDSGCEPDDEWLSRLVDPLQFGEYVTAGLTLATAGSSDLYDRAARLALRSTYLRECATINLAFRREAFDAIGGFDESFSYGSDVDFSWRLADAGYRIRGVPEAVIRHDWGNRKRQMRRSYLYGQGRMRLYKKHPARRRYLLRHDPGVIIYPLFLLGLPLTFVFPAYPALLLIPAWRNRADGPLRVVVDHLLHGLGALVEFLRR
jgi:glycosyltransferase involved in cell wall biosynthesis